MSNLGTVKTPPNCAPTMCDPSRMHRECEGCLRLHLPYPRDGLTIDASIARTGYGCPMFIDARGAALLRDAA